jgi:penicillin-binding protein 2
MKKEGYSYRGRSIQVGIAIFIIALIFLSKLFYIQVIDDSAKISAENNAVRTEIIYPARGQMIDRNGELVVYNKAAYDLMIIPALVRDFDTTELCQILDIDPQKITDRIEATRKMRYRPTVLVSQMTSQDYAKLQEVMHKYKGFLVQNRVVRAYASPLGSHILGYVSEVDSRHLKADKYYKMGDYVGVSGIEYQYEEALRGHKGQRKELVNALGIPQGSFENGKYDVIPKPGKKIQLTIDAELQKYGELLMKNKIGAIVAIEPHTGEVLALISAPDYNPQDLVGRSRNRSLEALQGDTLNHYLYRALKGAYPPGSPFKLLNGAIALEEGAINIHTKFSCNGTASRPIRCSHTHESPLDLLPALENSCNPFFRRTFLLTIEPDGQRSSARDGYTRWRNHLLSMGIGTKVGIDLPYEGRGFVPDPEYFDRYYIKGRWGASTIQSMAIGQGELLLTPLQMANQAAVIANRGYYYKPHVVKAIEGEEISQEYTERQESSISAAYFDPIVEGMARVYAGAHGTARWYQHDSIPFCGKTGTVQNPHGKDHSIFLAFAPKDNPKIAIAVVVENSGFGSTWAAPMATYMMEKYLTGKLQRNRLWKEKQVLEADFIHPKEQITEN